MPQEIQVLEFEIDDDRYCLDIDRVEQVVKRSTDDLTELPDSPPEVDGVMDLRGETTKIIDATRLFDADTNSETDVGQHIIVLESNSDDDDSSGWAVDEVDRVSRIEVDDMDETDDQQFVKGIINREEGFLIWATPDPVEA